MRLKAAARFARGEKSEAVARELRVTSRSVRRWRREWAEGGADALRSKGPALVERLSSRQWERLEDWPTFMLLDAVGNALFNRAGEDFPDYCVVATDGDRVVARGA
ncbi:helix-turn-helix domain-containing protein [Streptomyces sp. NPDC059215]|uniref:helix-turn-helix domain-containing protein n=1 Tax=unclassified Streptomyces TaxID=2593676 RepID=UPI00369C6E80